MNIIISDKLRQFALRIKSHLQGNSMTIGTFLQVLKLDNSQLINQESLVKIIEETKLEKSMFNPFKMNDQFRKAGQNINIQKFKQLYEKVTNDISSNPPNIKPNKIQQFQKKQEKEAASKVIQNKKIQEKPSSLKKIELQKQINLNVAAEIVQNSDKSFKKIIEKPESHIVDNPAAQTIKKQEPKNKKKESHQSVFEDQTPDYVIRQIKALIASDSRTLPLLFKESQLQNVIFIKKQHIKKLVSKIKIECLRNETLVQSIAAIIMKKQRISRYQLQVFFDEYGKNKKTSEAKEINQNKQSNIQNKIIQLQNKKQTKVQVQSKITPKPAQQQKKLPQTTKKIQQKIKPQAIMQSDEKKKAISASTQSETKSSIFTKLQQKKIQQKQTMHTIDSQTIQKPQIEKKQIKSDKNQPTLKKQEISKNNKDEMTKKHKVETKISEPIKQKQPLNRDTSHSRLNIRETTNQSTRKLFSSQQKSNLLVRNRLQSKKQSVLNNPKQSNDKFLLASHYFRLNSHTTQQQKSCMIKLQQLLKHKKQFVDNDNPEPILKAHAYTPINNIFPEKDYIVVSKSASQPITNEIINSKHVIQGQVGNCYLISVLATLAAVHPKKISELILFEANPSNYLAVRLFIDGQWRIIETDNRFACQDGRACYSKSFKNQIWAMLIEKAFAKYYESYKAIQSGSPLQSFFILTGAPCEQYYYKTEKVEVNQLVKVLKAHLSEGYLMGAAVYKTVQNETKATLKLKGLVMDHAYSLLDVIDVQNKLYVKMRNPWSNEVIWKGNWSEIAKGFSNQTKAKLNHDYEQKNGVFFMEWKYFYKYFNEVSICKINPNFFHTTLRLNFNKRKSNYIKLTIEKEGSYNIFICQQFERKYTSTYPFFSASNARLIIMKRDEMGQLTLISSKNTAKSQVCCQDLYLQSGVYIISAKIKWKSWPDHQASLVSYGVGKVKFELITNRNIVPTFKSSLIDEYIAQNRDKQQKFECIGSGTECVTDYKYFSMSEGIGYMRIVNTLPKTYKIKYDFIISGMKVIKPKQMSIIVELNQGQQQRIGFFVEPSQYSFHYKIKIIRF